uniref:VWFA domain-containing protein n=1 Tax=Callorhinchus milii TaxID=7868 RepID=A0A4W3J1J4_CALMI
MRKWVRERVRPAPLLPISGSLSGGKNSSKKIWSLNTQLFVGHYFVQLVAVFHLQNKQSIHFTVYYCIDYFDKRDIVFLIDGSANIGKGFPIVREFLSRMIGNFDAGEEKVRFGVTQFSENPRTEFLLNTYSTKNEMLSAVKKLKLKRGKKLNIGAALDHVMKNAFAASAGSRLKSSVPQILLLLTSEKSRDDISQQAAKLREMGIVTFTVGVKKANQAQLEQIAYAPKLAFSLSNANHCQPNNNNLVTRSMTVRGTLLCYLIGVQHILILCWYVIPMGFPGVIQCKYTLVHQTKGREMVDKCAVQEMERRMRAYISGSAKRLFFLKDDRTATSADIVFLVDASRSIGQENFPYVREFLFRVIKAFDIGEETVRFGLVQYGDRPQTEFRLNTYVTKQDILFHVWNMSFKGGGTKTGLGLEYVSKDQLSEAAGSRAGQGVPQIVVVLTDGHSQDDVGPPAASLKSADVMVFAIGVRQAVEWELKEIASAPHWRFIYRLNDFSIKLVAKYPCRLSRKLFNVRISISQETADLVFLIDGSNNVGRANFAHVRDFMVNFIENLDVGPDTIRIGVAQYSDDPSAEFYLNTYSTKTQVLDAVKGLQLRGGEELKTGAALQFLVDSYFTESAGSRAGDGVPQAVFLITSNVSSDDISQAEQALKEGSINAFCIGVRNADPNELTQIASFSTFIAICGPGGIYSLDLYCRRRYVCFQLSLYCLQPYSMCKVTPCRLAGHWLNCKLVGTGEAFLLFRRSSIPSLTGITVTNKSLLQRKDTVLLCPRADCERVLGGQGNNSI